MKRLWSLAQSGLCVFFTMWNCQLLDLQPFSNCAKLTLLLSLPESVWQHRVLRGVVLKRDSLSGPGPGCRLGSIIWATKEAFLLMKNDTQTDSTGPLF